VPRRITYKGYLTVARDLVGFDFVRHLLSPLKDPDMGRG
jgi:hypothetical protein